jgi:hypothetical protein
MSERPRTIPKYKVEVFDNNCWEIRAWRNNEYTAKTICEVESKSRRKPMRVIHEGKIIFKIYPEVSDGKIIHKNN